MTPAETENRSVPGAANSASIGGVTLGRELGRGGMAIVYEGMDPGFSPPRHVAVKLMAPNLSADSEFRTRFEREASLVAGFRHDNIIHVFASGDAGGAKYIVMEYLPGGNLASKIAQGGLAARDAIAAGAVLADALAYSHARGVVHRDFKPGNVLFTAEGKPVLSDFGVAKTASSLQTALTQYAAVIGAPRYMAPEQERGEPVTDRADVFSFGLTLFEMLTGGLPPPPERVLRAADEGKQIIASLANLPVGAAAIVCRCLVFDPAARPSARECADALTAMQWNSPANSAVRSRWPVTIGALAVALLIAAGVGLLEWPKWKEHAQAPALESRAPTTESRAALANGLRDLDVRHAQLVRRARESESAVEPLEKQMAAATREEERRSLQGALTEARAAAADSVRTLDIAEKQILTASALEAIHTAQAAGDSNLSREKNAEADKVLHAAVEKVKNLIDTVDALTPAMLAQRQFSQLDQRVSSIVAANGGEPRSVLMAPEQLAQRASDALSEGDSLRARSLFGTASLEEKSRAQSFINQVVAKYSLIAQQKMTANDLELARAAIDRAKSLRAMLSEL